MLTGRNFDGTKGRNRIFDAYIMTCSMDKKTGEQTFEGSKNCGQY